MRQKLADEALKGLSLRIGLLWLRPNGFDTPIGKTPDVATADAAIQLTVVYIRARAEFDARNYLGAIQIATEGDT